MKTNIEEWIEENLYDEAFGEVMWESIGFFKIDNEKIRIYTVIENEVDIDSIPVDNESVEWIKKNYRYNDEFACYTDMDDEEHLGAMIDYVSE